MTTYISNIDHISSGFRTLVEQTMRYMDYRSIPLGLKRRVREYFSHKWRRTRGFVERTLIDELPYSISCTHRS